MQKSARGGVEPSRPGRMSRTPIAETRSDRPAPGYTPDAGRSGYGVMTVTMLDHAELPTALVARTR